MGYAVAIDPDRPDWERDGRDWPNREASRFVRAGGLRWHVQVMGEGPPLLLLHGTGAATHSWRSLAPLLAERFTVVAPDLPGHGFTSPFPRGRPSLTGMARAVADLLAELELAPQVAVGHSAGAAIEIRMTLDGAIAPALLVGLNGALLPFGGIAGQLFPPMAKVLFLNPLAPRLFSWAADRGQVERLLRNTGSKIDERGLELYGRLFRTPGHVAGALGMMANWDLESFERDLGRLATPTLLLVGGNDQAVLPDVSFQVRDRLADSTVKVLRGLGHLAHEEDPAQVAALILERAAGLAPPTLDDDHAA
ncbi:alpha/beta fold hydrolase BchO [Alsobacter sp. KACC 23698]|uniref:Alpha/beta fold hydrolase BchO n=1 Tax=Alsobacter sp. KACC 23698 TaxID=3149229 RepID=A0AAU7JDS5_9HYPH